jgi:hypothetical protein
MQKNIGDLLEAFRVPQVPQKKRIPYSDHRIADGRAGYDHWS